MTLTFPPLPISLVLSFEDHGDSGEDIGDQVSCAHGDTDTDDSYGSQDSVRIHSQIRQRVVDKDQDRDVADQVRDQPADRLSSGIEHFAQCIEDKADKQHPEHKAAEQQHDTGK